MRLAAALAGVLALAAAGYALATAGAPQDSVTTQTFTFTNEGAVTYTIPTVTVTVTTTVEPPPAAPPPPPAPPSNPCTKELAAGGDLSTFLGTLGAGDIGCLHAGDYTDGCAISWTGSGATLQPYGDEHVIVHTSLGLAGNSLTVRRLEVTIPSSCGTSTSGMTVQGANDTLEFNYIHDVPRHGILTNTSSSNVTVHGNYIDTTGSTCNLDHGIYWQTTGRITRNVITNSRCGYGIQLYVSSGSTLHDTIVAENVSNGSVVRSGIVIQNAGPNMKIVNNLFTNNAVAGITARSCGTGCLIDNNIVWGNGVDCDDCAHVTNMRHTDPLYADMNFRVAALSPAVDTATPAFAYFPDLDGIAGVLGVGPDLGAYER